MEDLLGSESNVSFIGHTLKERDGISHLSHPQLGVVMGHGPSGLFTIQYNS